MRRSFASLAVVLAGCFAAGATLASPPPGPAAHAGPAPAAASLARAPAADAPARIAPLAGVVERVHDGDSFRMRATDGREIGVRIAGIDAPERTQPYANVSRRAMREAIEGREVRVDPVKIDRYGRVVGHVFVDGNDIGIAQLQAGLAWHFARYDADLAPVQRLSYARAQADAKARGVGLWKQPAPLAPWRFRQQQR